MKSLRISSIRSLLSFLICANFLFLLNPMETQAASLVFSVTASTSTTQVKVGDTVTLNLAVKNNTTKSQTTDVILTVTDSSGTVVYTKTWAGQSFAKSKTINYSTTYTIGVNALTGNYSVGVVLKNTARLITYYNNSASLVFSVTAATSVASPTQWWQPTPDKPIHWHWQLSDDFAYPRDVLPNVTVYDIDGQTATAATVAQLHALGPNVKVICYFDAGVYETYRPDASLFPASVIGNPDQGWSGSYWLDIRQTAILLPIMQNRMQQWCKDKGFDAIEPDETEVWSNNSGFPITKDQNNFYNQQIAQIGHSLGLSVALKGNTSEAPYLWTYFDFTINEQCWQYNECDLLKSSFLDHGKAVLNIEYNVNPNCLTANSWHMNSARRDLNLVGPANQSYYYSPCVPDSKDTW